MIQFKCPILAKKKSQSIQRKQKIWPIPKRVEFEAVRHPDK
jgi:hypothetical protein